MAIGKVQGIDVAEHPWKEMIGDKKSAPEKFAAMIPNDNYYIHFKQIAKFIEFAELLDQWGTNITRAYEVTSRDYRLKERYEQQLCLRSTGLGKTLGPLVIKGIAHHRQRRLPPRRVGRGHSLPGVQPPGVPRRRRAVPGGGAEEVRLQAQGEQG